MVPEVINILIKALELLKNTSFSTEQAIFFLYIWNYGM